MDITAHEGEPFELSFDRYGTAGYIWEIQSLPAEFTELRPSSTSADKSQPPGEPSLQRFLFVADKPGFYHLIFASRRPWEQAPERIERVTVKVLQRE